MAGSIDRPCGLKVRSPSSGQPGPSGKPKLRPQDTNRRTRVPQGSPRDPNGSPGARRGSQEGRNRAFRAAVVTRLEKVLPVDLAYQDLQDLPAGFHWFFILLVQWFQRFMLTSGILKYTTKAETLLTVGLVAELI